MADSSDVGSINRSASTSLRVRSIGFFEVSRSENDDPERGNVEQIFNATF